MTTSVDEVLKVVIWGFGEAVMHPRIVIVLQKMVSIFSCVALVEKGHVLVTLPSGVSGVSVRWEVSVIREQVKLLLVDNVGSREDYVWLQLVRGVIGNLVKMKEYVPQA